MAGTEEQRRSFTVLYNALHDAAINDRNGFLGDVNREMLNMLSDMGETELSTLRESVRELVRNSLNGEGEGESSDVGFKKVVEDGGKRIKDLELKEKKLVKEFNKVLANLYLLPGYVLAVSTSVSGLLSSDPRVCGLVIPVIFVVLGFIAALVFSIPIAYLKLGTLREKQRKLKNERSLLYSRIETYHAQYSGDELGTMLRSLKIENFDLDFQASYYHTFLWFVGICGGLYAFMLGFTGYRVLCSEAIPVETIPDHSSFDSYLHQAM